MLFKDRAYLPNTYVFSHFSYSPCPCVDDIVLFIDHIITYYYDKVGFFCFKDLVETNNNYNTI